MQGAPDLARSPGGDVTIVIPCYNEEQRLDEARLRAFAASARVRLVCVNDGSTDGTLARLRDLAATAPEVTVVDLPKNQGKAEAVRQGLLAALADGAAIVGYYDADLATPPDEMERLVDVLRRDQAIHFAMGARVSLLGRRIERKVTRHYLGRVFASIASLLLGLRVYDTQCGAKVIRASAALRTALVEPFLSRWAFDVELIGRLLTGTREIPPVPLDGFVEIPLGAWHDVKGSKLVGSQMVGVLAELALIERDLLRRRARRR